jgi:titin
VIPRTIAGAPTGLSATGGNLSASIAFTAPTSTGGAAITNYEYSINNGAWTARNPVATTSPLSLTGLVNGTTYSIKLRAVNAAGGGTESASVSVTPGSPLGAPTGLSATAGNASVSIAFTPPSSTGGAAITNYEYSINNGAWTARSPAATTSPLSLTGLVNGTTYSIKLRAVNAAGGGTESVAVSVTPGVPGQPTAVRASPGNASASITFMYPANNGAAITKYEYSNNNGAWTACNQVNSTTLSITGLVNGTTYSIKIRAVNAVGGGTESAAVSVTPGSQPTAPTGLSATAGNTTASIAFTAPASTGGSAITNYQILIDNGTWNPRSPAATTSPLSLTGLTNGRTYSIKLRAVNATGGGNESVAVSVTPGLAGAPTNLVATATNGGASIAFTAPASTGGAAITNYQYAINNGAWTARSPVATTSPLSLTGLVNGTSYSIKLRAVNAVSGGTESAAVSVMPRVGSAAARISISPIPGGDGNDPVVIYPNPISGGSFFIQTSLGDSKDVILKISDMRGREVYRQVRPEMSAGRIRAVLPPRIANGTYVIELMIDGKSHFSRLQVAR